MALNRKFYAPRYTVKAANGEEVCTVRGITPDDIAKIMTDNAADVEAVMQLLERDEKIASVDYRQDEQLAAAMDNNLQRLFGILFKTVPTLLARIIAVACDDDTPEAVEHIKREFVAPMQLDVLTQIAKLTFVDTNGFKAFMGNVLGLAGIASSAKTDQPSPAKLSQPTSDTAG